jgi:hypothetical protein
MNTQTVTMARERWIGAALLICAAALFSIYVIVLQRDVGRAQLAQAQAHARALAEMQCEDDSPADQRWQCVSLLQDDAKADARTALVRPVPPENDLHARAGAAWHAPGRAVGGVATVAAVATVQ